MVRKQGNIAYLHIEQTLITSALWHVLMSTSYEQPSWNNIFVHYYIINIRVMVSLAVIESATMS